MNPDPGRSATEAAARARAAPVDELRQRLAHAPVPYLVGALENPRLDTEGLVVLLRNRGAPPSILTKIWRNRGWTRFYDVKKGLVRHPKTPLPIARSLVHHLYWRDLAQTADDLTVHPSIRRQSEELLKVRLLELTLGERISLARMASPGLISSLRETGEERVLLALLGNAKMREPDAVQIASGREVPGPVLDRLAAHPMWGRRHAVRIALVTNPRTPIAVALQVVRKFPRRDLDRLANDRRAPKIVRMGAVRHLERLGRRPPRSGLSPGTAE